MPHSIRVRVTSPKAINPSREAIQIVEEIYDRKETEPLAHELLREARDVATANPRSALLICVSALETGLKTYIQAIVPHSGIILEKMQSPPAVTLMQEVIPSLHAELKKPVCGFPLDDANKKFLQKWITQRNQVAHGLKQSVDIDGLFTFIDFVQGVLYELDALRGHKWAETFAVLETHRGGDATVSVTQ